MRLSEIQENAHKMVVKHGWSKHPLSVRLKYFREECEEFLKELSSWDLAVTPEQRYKAKLSIGFEMYDIIWNLAEIANRLEINLDEVARLKQEINAKRVWDD